jgi:hypothetical protein
LGTRCSTNDWRSHLPQWADPEEPLQSVRKLKRMSDYDSRLRFIRKLANTELACGKSLLDLTTYEDTAMWWFVELGFDAFLRTVPNTRSAGQPVSPKRMTFDVHRLVGIFGDILETGLLRLLVGIHERNRSGVRNGKRLPKVVFTAQDAEWRVFADDETGRLKKSDAFFDSILKKLVNEYECLGVYPVMMTRRRVSRQAIRSIRILIDKLKNWYVPHVPLESYWSLDVRRSERNASRYFAKVWSRLARDQRFREVSAGDYDSIADGIRAQIENCFHVTFPFVVRWIELAERMLYKEKPDVVLIVNEYGVFERALLVAAKRLGIRTLAIQHGNIHPYHRGYMYAKEEIGPDASGRSPYCPIAERTAVYGPYHRDLLTKCSAYPENSVVVTGQPRYDRLSHLDKIYSRRDFLTRHGISSDHKVVLWATECEALSMEENIANFRAVFGTIAALKDTTLIVKEHPGEREIYTRIIKSYLKGCGGRALLTSPTSDVYEQLFACDLLIARYSTTVIEAVALEKPVIVLNLTGEPGESMDYVGEGVALGAYREEDLGPAIEKLLKDDSELSRNRKRFIERYLYELDGKASERVAELVKEMIGMSYSGRDLSRT